MTRRILVPLGYFNDTPGAQYVWEVILADESEWSERERRRVQAFIDEGLLWSASIEDDEANDRKTVTSSTGQGAPVSLTVPNFVSDRLLAEMMGQVLDRLED